MLPDRLACTAVDGHCESITYKSKTEIACNSAKNVEEFRAQIIRDIIETRLRHTHCQ